MELEITITTVAYAMAAWKALELFLLGVDQSHDNWKWIFKTEAD